MIAFPAETAGLASGFDDLVDEAQSTFRAVLDALSRPGHVVEVGRGLTPPHPLEPATAALGLSLFDLDTPVWFDAAAAMSEVETFFRFHCGCPVVASPGEARFAVIADPSTMPAVDAFDLGSDEAPDRSATLIIQVRGFKPKTGLKLTGPGINGETRIGIGGAPGSLLRQRREVQALFPRGVDIFFAAGSRLMGLPRTTSVEF